MTRSFNLSYSAVSSLLDDCAYRFGLTRIVGLKDPPNARLAVGIAHHEAIEAHERARMHGQPDGLPLDELVQLARASVYAARVDWEHEETEITEAADQAAVAVSHWYETSIPEGQRGAGGSLRDRVLPWRPILVEARFKLHYPPHTSLPVVGQIDGVYLDEHGGLVGVDQKSAKNWNKWKLKGESATDQAAFYLSAMRRVPAVPRGNPRRPARFEYHVTRFVEGTRANFQGVRVLAPEITHHDLRYIDLRLELAHEMQLEGRWGKNPESFFCSAEWCPFYETVCDPYGPQEYDIESYREENDGNRG